MIDIWNAYGFYLWAMTTVLVIITLAWLAWQTFGASPEVESTNEVDPAALEILVERVNALAEAAPHMQSTLGRTLQYFGLIRYSDVTGAQAFSLAISNARGDGFVLSSSVRGGFTAKTLIDWAGAQPLNLEEQSAVDQARGQKG